MSWAVRFTNDADKAEVGNVVATFDYGDGSEFVYSQRLWASVEEAKKFIIAAKAAKAAHDKRLADAATIAARLQDALNLE